MMELPDTLNEETLTPLGAKKQPTSYQERNLAYLMHKAPQNPTNHLSKAIEITANKNNLNINALQISINKVIELNPNLRAVFIQNLENNVNKYILPYDPNIKLLKQQDIINLSEQEKKNRIETLLKKPFMIGEYPMIRAHLLKTDAKKYYLILSMSHMLGDGYSSFLIFGLIQHIYNFIVRPVPYYDNKIIYTLCFSLGDILYNKLFIPVITNFYPGYQNLADQYSANIFCSAMQTYINHQKASYKNMCERQKNYLKNKNHPAYCYFQSKVQYASFTHDFKKNPSHTNSPQTAIHLFTTQMSEAEIEILKKISKKYKASTPRLLLTLFHLTLYYYSKRPCVVRTLDHHRRANESYSIGYFAQDIISFCGNLTPEHTFQQMLNGVKDHFLIQKTLDQNNFRPSQIPASYCFNSANKPLETEFNYIQDLNFKINLQNLETKSDNNLQDESILETWNSPIHNEYGYNIAFSMYVNNTAGKISIQIISAKHLYKHSFSSDFYQTYLDNIKRVWFLNNTPISILCKTDASNLEIQKENESSDENLSLSLSDQFKKSLSNNTPSFGSCAILTALSITGIAIAANYGYKKC